MVVPPALALGAWSSRVVAGSPGRAVAVLTSGAVLTLVLGLRGSPVPWLAPPIMRTARELASGAQAGPLIGLTAWALVWGGRGAVRVRLAATVPGRDLAGTHRVTYSCPEVLNDHADRKSSRCDRHGHPKTAGHRGVSRDRRFRTTGDPRREERMLTPSA
jgi:hypothetical protein